MKTKKTNKFSRSWLASPPLYDLEKSHIAFNSVSDSSPEINKTLKSIDLGNGYFEIEISNINHDRKKTK